MVPQIVHTHGAPDVAFVRQGRNQASTFQGLCAKHDQEMFRPIEVEPIDVENEMHLFLLAYRAVLRETHTVLQGAAKMQAGYQGRVEAGTSPRHAPDAAGLEATSWVVNAYDTHEYKRKFDAAYLERDYQRLGQWHIVFEDVPPSIAVNSLFSLDDVDRTDDVARVALNIFPEARQTHVVFSFLMEEKPFAAQYVQRILDATGSYQRYLVSKLVLQHCENFAMSPTYFETLSAERRNTILAFFRRTMTGNEHDYEDPHLYLF